MPRYSTLIVKDFDIICVDCHKHFTAHILNPGMAKYCTDCGHHNDLDKQREYMRRKRSGTFKIRCPRIPFVIKYDPFQEAPLKIGMSFSLYTIEMMLACDGFVDGTLIEHGPTILRVEGKQMIEVK